ARARLDRGRPRVIFETALDPRPEIHHGENQHRPDKARQQRRYRLFLCDEEESADQDEQARTQEVRPGGAQARRLPRSKDQIAPASVRRAIPSSAITAFIGEPACWIADVRVLRLLAAFAL